MIRHVLIEGPDGSGKTTLANHLRDQHGYAVIHHGPPAWNDFALLDIYKAAVSKQTQAGQPTAFDRLVHSELVYGTVLRGESKVTGAEVAKFSDWFHALGGIIVLCLPAYHVCHARWLERTNKGEELIDSSKEQQFREIWETYDQLRRWVNSPFEVVVHGNWDDLVSGFDCRVLCR